MFQGSPCLLKEASVFFLKPVGPHIQVDRSNIIRYELGPLDEWTFDYYGVEDVKSGGSCHVEGGFEPMVFDRTKIWCNSMHADAIRDVASRAGTGGQRIGYNVNLPALYTTYELTLDYSRLTTLEMIQLGTIEEIRVNFWFNGHDIQAATHNFPKSCHAHSWKCSAGTFGPCRNKTVLDDGKHVCAQFNSSKQCDLGLEDCYKQTQIPPAMPDTRPIYL